MLHSAHEFKTAHEAFLRILALIEGTADLDRRVQRVHRAHGEEGIELRTGQRLRFVARSRGSGRGFSGDDVFLDEAYNLADGALAALMPTMSARPNPQLWYTSSAPLATEESRVLRRFCRRGRRGAPRLVYVEYAAETGADLDDRTAWADANPAFGVRISEEFIETERGAMSDEDFARERLGLWPDDDDERSRVIPSDDWDACEDTASQPLEPLSFAVDVAPDRSSAAIGVAGLRRDGRVHIEVIEHRPGASWVVDRLAAVLRKAELDAVTLTPNAAAGGLMNELGLAGITVNECNTIESTQACGAFFDGIMDRRYLHIGQPVLGFAVDGAEKRRSGDAWVWDRRNSSGDITPLVTVTLAAWALHQYAAPVDVASNIW